MSEEGAPEYERCADPILEGFPTDDIGSCHLPKGHAGMHMPLPVLWQLTGDIPGPWNPDSAASERMRELLSGGPGKGRVVMLAPGEVVVTPERAEALGLTADARRMRRERGEPA